MFVLRRCVSIHYVTAINRICPGRFFADNVLWLTIACTLATFDITPYVDPGTGLEDPPEVEYLPTVVRRVTSVKRSFTILNKFSQLSKAV